MKKIGIITFHAAHNYGSVLQAYATQTVLERLGYSTEIINYRLKNQREFYNNLYSRQFGFKDFLKRLYRLPEHKQRAIRSEKFEKFIHEKLLLSEHEYRTYDQLVKADLNYDLLVSGSDQVWNRNCVAEFATEPSESILGYFLAFGGDDVKRISFSSSIGAFKEEKISDYLKYLSKYDYLSVREQISAEALSEMLKKNVKNTLDPTLLLNYNDWDSICTKQEENEKYIFVYSLASFRSVQQLLKSVRILAEKHNLKVISVTPFSSVHVKGIDTRQDCGPLDFINYIKNAELVITNSFHGTAFSINMSTPFYSIKADSDKRKSLLMERLGLPDRTVSSVSEIEQISDYSCDYTNTQMLLEKEREDSLNYFADILRKVI